MDDAAVRRLAQQVVASGRTAADADVVAQVLARLPAAVSLAALLVQQQGSVKRRFGGSRRLRQRWPMSPIGVRMNPLHMPSA